MKKHFVTKENLAYLGALDDFYDLYYTLTKMYEAEWENSRNSISDVFSAQIQINRQLKFQTKELVDSFLCKYTYLFTKDYTRLHPNATSMKWIYVIDLKIDYLGPIRIKTIPFREFLNVLEQMVVFLIWNKVLHDRPKTPYEIIENKVRQHFENLVESERNRIAVHSSANHNPPQNVIVFKSLSSISCNRKGHVIENSAIEVEVLNSNASIMLPIHHCKNCGRIFIGNETLKQYEKVWGRLVISTRNDSTAADEIDFYTTESPLHKLGYNVVAGNLSGKERQDLLIKIYENKWLTLFEIQRDIEKAIRIFESRNRYKEAVKKWKDDLYFITEYVKNIET